MPISQPIRPIVTRGPRLDAMRARLAQVAAGLGSLVGVEVRVALESAGFHRPEPGIGWTDGSGTLMLRASTTATELLVRVVATVATTGGAPMAARLA